MRRETQLILTNHAYLRYCERVEPIDRDELTMQLQQATHHPERIKRQYIQILGVWYRFGRNGNTVTLHTCYGRHVGDLPAAIRWAKLHGDRIALGGQYDD